MNTRIYTVTSAKGNKEKRRPCIKMHGQWLNEIGFCHNALLTIECSKDAILLKLCDRATINHFELSKKILKEDAKGIFHVGSEWRKTGNVSTICLSGFWLEKFGFTIASVIAVRFEYGILKIKRLDLGED
jgi:hypothetical protein